MDDAKEARGERGAEARDKLIALGGIRVSERSQFADGDADEKIERKVVLYASPGAEYRLQDTDDHAKFASHPAGKLDSKQLTIVHEVSHFYDTFGSLDHAFTQYNTRRLAQSNPELAITNADSIAWYVLCTD